MKQFNKIFGKAMIEVTPDDIAMLGSDVPVVTANGYTYADFVTWANKAFSPNLELVRASINSGSCVVCQIMGVFNEKSASTLKANGFTEWAITMEELCDDDGRSSGYSDLFLNIPVHV